jgi:hypothetical protein
VGFRSIDIDSEARLAHIRVDNGEQSLCMALLKSVDYSKYRS